MIKNFLLKKGDQLAFNITFTSNVTFDSVELGVKADYTDEAYTIIKTLGDGITRLSGTTYQFTISSSDTKYLKPELYPYDIRVIKGDVIKTPLSGFIMINDTVFERP